MLSGINHKKYCAKNTVLNYIKSACVVSNTKTIFTNLNIKYESVS